MVRNERAAALVGLLCVALVALTLPSFVWKVREGRTSLVQSSSAARAEFKNAQSELGAVLTESMDLTSPKAKKAAPKASASTILSKAKGIDAEANALKFLESQVQHNSAVLHNTKLREQQKQEQLRLAAEHQLEPLLKEEAVADTLYKSSVQKLRAEQAKAAALMRQSTHSPAGSPMHSRAHKAAAAHGAPKQKAAAKQRAVAGGGGQMSVHKDGSLALLSPKDGKFHMPMFPGPSGAKSTAEWPAKYEHDPGCVPPQAMGKDDKCYGDPRSEPVPHYCKMEPEGQECKAYHKALKGRVMQYFVDLRSTYPYRYHRHFYQNPGATHAKHVVQPQRFPHRDGADLGDNYISGWRERYRGHGDLDDSMVSGLNLKSHNPAVLAPFAPVHTDDRRGPQYKEKLPPAIEAMEKRGQAHTFDDQIVPWDQHEDYVRRRAWPALQASRDRLEPAGRHEQQILKGFEGDKVDPFGINIALKDQEVPAGKVYREHRGHNYWRGEEGEPFSDFMLGSWGGWKGQDVLPKDAQKKNEDKWDDEPPLDDSLGAGAAPAKKKAAGAAPAGEAEKEYERDPGTPDVKKGFINLPA